MDVIKKHKTLVIVGIIAVVLLIFGFFVVKLFYVNSNSQSYGDRLDGRDQMLPSTELKNKIITNMKAKGFVNDVVIEEKGLIINFLIAVKPGTERETAKALTETIMPEFTDNQKRFFDFQVFLTSKDDKSEAPKFPIIGYRHKSLDSFVWTNN